MKRTSAQKARARTQNRVDLEAARAALKETDARLPWKLLRLEVANDLKAFSDRAQEPSIQFQDLIKDMKRRGKL